MIACQICSQICPQKAVDRVERLDTETKGFTVKQSITVGGAREIQRVYGQIVALALGHEASLLYKVNMQF
jgi:Fe-S-cluster-containing hydrogenase component 2